LGRTLFSVEMGAEILIYFPCISDSITLPLNQLARKLVEKGHNVTFATAFPLKNVEATNVIVGAEIREMMDKDVSKVLFGGGEHGDTPLFDLSIKANEDAVIKLKEMNKKFDTVMVYPLFGNEVGLYLARYWSASLVLYFTDQPTVAAWLDHVYGSYGEGNQEPLRDGALEDAVKGIIKRQFPEEEQLHSLSIMDLEKQANCAIAAANPLLMQGLRPIPPNLVYCGMMQCKPSQPLSGKLRKFMDSATEGVLYVSFGSVLLSCQLPEDKKKAMLNIFRNLKEKVLWKWEDDNLEDMPDNVMVMNYLPQQDILGHPNCKGFITHAGYLSFEEGIAHQVPMMATPICYDQYDNAKEIERLGIGRCINFTDITETTLSEALDQVLHDPSISERSRSIGSSLAPWSEMVGPVDRAAWWLEHVTKHKEEYTFENFYQKYPKSASK